MKSVARTVRNVHQKELIKLFDSLCARQSRWTVWSDFIVMSAISISNSVDLQHAKEREETYRTLSGKYNAAEMEGFSNMLAEVVMGMEQNPDQDFLGELFMNLGLSNDHNGQFFTPYCVCKCMAGMQENFEQKIEEQGFITVNDPTCGAGALLVAFANTLRDRKINYQRTTLFVAQDIDYVVDCMCYIALSLMGCAGYVAIDNTLTKPVTAYDDRCLIPVDNGQIWYTPMFFHDIWTTRRMLAGMRTFERQHRQEPEPEQEPTQEPTQEPVEVKAPKEPLLITKSEKKVQKTEVGYQFSENKNGQISFF